MFGDKPMFGQTKLIVDDKNRIIVPSNTDREPGEQLILLYNQELKIYEIYGVKRLEERYKELDNLVLNSKNKRDKIFYQKMLLELSKSILISAKVESNGKIAIGKIFEDSKEILCTGANDRLIIEPIKIKK